MSDTVSRIKERLSIVDVVSTYVKLTRAGKYWKGLSPFTKEKTPSFFVTPDRGLYHCFSTGKGGDMFTFIEEMEGVDFKGALKILAERAGVPIVHESRESRDEREALYAALEAATQFFESNLAEHADALAYLKKRGIEEKTLKKWRVGYAPKEWRALRTHLESKGFSESSLIGAGLIKRPDGEDSGAEGKQSYDRFRGRLMFPIFDPSGRPIAFSGRIFEDDPAHPQAKYLNSPEGPLFDKSRALYGIHEAKQGIRELGFSMLVEGQVDLILAHQAGYRSCVATSGTAFTASHAEILKRYSDNILLAYDGDTAGVQATYRAARVLLPLRMNVKAVVLPEGKDPADVIKESPHLFKDAVRSAVGPVDFFAQALKSSVTDSHKLMNEIAKAVMPLIVSMDREVDRSFATHRLAELVGISDEQVLLELERFTHDPQKAETAVTNAFFTEDSREKLLYGILLTFEESGDARARRVEEMFVATYGAERLRAHRAGGELSDDSARVQAYEYFFKFYESSAAQDAFLTELESKAQKSSLREKFNHTKHELAQAEKAGDTAEAERLVGELDALSKKLE